MKKIAIVTGIVCFAVVNLFAQNGISHMDIAKMQSVTFSTISPDGQKVLYGVVVPTNPTEANESMKQHVYSYDISSGTSAPFITQGSVRNMHFRPGHNSVTFLTRRGDDKNTALYEISFSGGEASKLYDFDASISAYEWHPDGESIVFLSRGKSNKNSGNLPYKAEVYEEGLSNTHAYVSGIGEEARLLPVDGHISAATWNHDGSKLALVVAPTALVDDSYTRKGIVITDASGKVEGEVVHKAKLGKVAWSPDGKHIAFIGGKDEHDPKEARLMYCGQAGGYPTIIHRDFEGSFDDFEWADNQTIMCIASEGVYTSLGTITLKGKWQKTIDKGSIAFTGFSRSSTGMISLTGNSSDHPGELFLMEKGTKSAKRITHTNEWLENRAMGKQEVFTYKAKDGLTIEGILIRPVNEQPGTRYPLITIVHGGPEAHYDQGWLTYYSMPGQLAAAQGYAVFYPNYRGSTGRGLQFAKSSQADPGGKEFDDIIDGIDALIDVGLVDENKVGVTGGSYGGYCTAWMATRHSERFAAGVMFVGISNNLSKWGTSDIPEEMFLVHSRKRIWEDYQFFLERSPIFYADQAQTPILIMAGKDDTRVDPGQSYELYRHIKTRTETPVRLVLYPGEGHGNRNATARFDYSIRQMRWFNNYLKGDGKTMPPMDVTFSEE